MIMEDSIEDVSVPISRQEAIPSQRSNYMTHQYNFLHLVDDLTTTK